MDSRGGYPADEKSWMDAPTRLPGGVDLGGEGGEISIQETDAEMKRQYIGSLPFYPLCPECR
ncbi:hypothetical protein [Methanogenium cariaci]|uniref:hypothetical protein n=1 Tax=Methanogenium cariaci TaxID=2197 RepID=UPI0012F67A85|nr:hypothetical protein [Methanogenium cariaci]